MKFQVGNDLNYAKTTFESTSTLLLPSMFLYDIAYILVYCILSMRLTWFSETYTGLLYIIHVTVS